MSKTPTPHCPDLARQSPRGGRAFASVLVVDDNRASLELARIMLEQRANFRSGVLYANGAEEALATLRQCAKAGAPVDLVFLDINMPGTDGFEVLAALAAEEHLPQPAVIMCSTSSFDRDIERARTLGAAGYMEKPPRLEALRALLGSLTPLALEENEDGVFLVRQHISLKGARPTAP